MFRPKFTLIPYSLFLIPILWSCHNSHQPSANSIPTSIINIPASASGHTNDNLPVIKFADTAYDFGTIKEGDKVSHPYTFTNKGKADLIISSAKGGCSCTSAIAPTGIIHPGQSAQIDVTLNSKGIYGKVVKLVYVTTNCLPNSTYLTFTANISPTNN